MKRVLLVFASLLIGLTTATATEQNNTTSKIKLEKKKNYRNAEPIVFMERGIEFLIFPDGTFDFNTKTNHAFYNDAYYRNNSRRSNMNTSQRGPNANIGFTSAYKKNRGVSILRDRTGKVRRIGNVFLNYDRRGNITRVGSVFIDYTRGRNKLVNQIGGLRVNYNRFGEIINTRGHINRNNNRNYNDYYYLKKKGKVIKQNKGKKSKR
ncbi:hypothetical protein [Algibacter sp. R77976]|uniref:hypothetical protein n=1 Tax=Algibacter sp. R77976 TaxID=3093873 RepID=UPI0037C84528